MIFAARASSRALVTTSRTAIISSKAATVAAPSAGTAGAKSVGRGQPASCTERARPSSARNAGGKWSHTSSVVNDRMGLITRTSTSRMFMSTVCTARRRADAGASA